MTDDDKTPDPAPALLSTARLAEIRAAAQATIALWSDLPEEVKRGLEWHRDAANALDLLAHLDALTPRAAPDGEALGAEVRRIRGEFTWGEALRKEEEAEDRAIGLALHAIGYAAGRSEGEVERVRATQEGIDIGRAQGWKEANVEIDRLVAARAGERASAAEAIEGQAAEIARLNDLHLAMVNETNRLTAKLAEARATGERAEQAMRLRDASLSRVEADRARKEADARLAGAREERRRLLDQLSFFVKVHTETEDERGRGEGQGS